MRPARPVTVPEALVNRLLAHRPGTPLPREYVELHASAAAERLSDLRADLGLRVAEAGLVEDAFVEEMLVTQVVVRTRSGRVVTLLWNPLGGDYVVQGDRGNLAIREEDLS